MSILLSPIIPPAVSYDYSNNEVVDYKKAAIIAHDYVEEKIGKCNWKTYNITGKELSNPSQFEVMEKFTCNDEEYIYKIIVQYFGEGKEWNDTKNWDYSQLTIENVKTG